MQLYVYEGFDAILIIVDDIYTHEILYCLVYSDIQICNSLLKTIRFREYALN